MSFGSKVKEIREARGMSQLELAEIVGFKTKGSISKIEHGVVDPPHSMIVKLSKALNVNPVVFFDFASTKDYSKSPYIEFVPYLENASEEELSIIRKILDMPQKKSNSTVV